MEAVKAQLMSEYRKTRGTLQLLPGISEDKPSMEDIFVDLQLSRIQSKFGRNFSSKLKSHNDLFKVVDDQGQIMKHVLVKGDPGCGKSTLVSKIAYDWAKNEDSNAPFAQFQLVFAIDMKEVVRGRDLMDIIQEQLLPKVSKRGLERYIQSNAKSVLFLFDGYDEIPREFLDGSCREFMGVLSSKLFPDSFVILTTRPHKVAAINNLYRTHYAQVEIYGLPIDSIFKFISEFFGVALGHIDWVNRHKFVRKLSARDARVMEPPRKKLKVAETVASLIAKLECSKHFIQVCRYPMTLSMLCYVWKEKQDFSLILTRLYHEAVFHVAKNRARVNEDGDIDIYDVEKRVDDLLMKLGKVALDGLLENKLLFTGNHFDPDTLNEACEVGLVSKERKRSSLNPVDHVVFLHKTYQEMSAGYYLGSLAESDVQMFSSYQAKVSDLEDAELILRFCCGANSKAATLILSGVLESSCALRHQLENVKKIRCFLGHPQTLFDPWRMPLLLLFEAELNSSSVELEKLHGLFKPLVSKLQIEANSNDAQSEVWAVLGTLTDRAQGRSMDMSWFSLIKEAFIVDTSNPASSSVLGFSQFHVKDPIVGKAVSCMSNLKELTLLGGHSQDCSSLLDNMAQSQKAPELLTQLTCRSYYFDPQTMAQFLKCQKSLTKLHIEGATGPLTKKFVPKQTSKMITALVKVPLPLKVLLLEDIALGQYVSCLKPLLPRLEELQLSRLYVDETNDCKIFFQMFSEIGENLPLVKLSVAGNELSEAVDGFAEALKCVPDLQFLDLQHYDYKKPGKLEDQHFIIFGPALKYVPNLTSLDLTGNLIGSAAREVGQGLQSLKKLQVLKIGCSNLTEESVPFLPFEDLQKLETLSIGGNKFGKGVRKVAERLKSLHRLRNLEFSSAGLTDEDVVLLPLSSFPNLTSLDLRDNAMWSDGLCTIAKQLKYMPSLESLLLFQNVDEGDEVLRGNQCRVGIEEIIRNLYHVPKMVTLWFPVKLYPEVYMKSELLTECVKERVFYLGNRVPVNLTPEDMRNAICFVNAFNLAKVNQACV